MAHDHHHCHHAHGGHHHHHGHDSVANLKIAFFLNLFFTVFEFFGGLWTNSLAIMSDALHDLGDSFSLGAAWGLARVAQLGGNRDFSFGYKRLSLVGALLNSLILIGGSIFILIKAIPRLIDPQQPHAPGMILFALVGIAANGAAVLRLRQGKTLNEQVISWHLIEDVLGWVAVLAVSIVMLFVNLPILDPILSVLLTLYILSNVVRSLKQTVKIFLQGVPGTIDIHQIEEKIRLVPNVVSVHDTHIWSLDGEYNLLTTHAVIGKDSTPADNVLTKQEIKRVLQDEEIHHTTIEVEYEGEECHLRDSPVGGCVNHTKDNH